MVAKTIAHALTTARPRARYLAGKNSWRMALIAANLPTPVRRARRRITHQPAPGHAPPARARRRRAGQVRAPHLAAGDGRARRLAQVAIRHADDHRSEIEAALAAPPTGRN